MTAGADIVEFWIEAGPKAWFRKDDAFDAVLRKTFEAAHLAASRGGETGGEGSWREALATLLLLDQVPRNIWRGSAHAFATDPLAQAMAKRAIAAGLDLQAPDALQIFFYLPLEHAEDAAAQAQSLEVFADHATRTGDDQYLRFARLHAEIIDRFGRFPHRNVVLGRETTPEEAEFLATGGFAG